MLTALKSDKSRLVVRGPITAKSCNVYHVCARSYWGCCGQSGMSLAAVASDSSLRVKQFRHRHPFVPVGTGSAGGRSEHQQSWPGLQEMGALHCEQNVFIVEFKFSVSRVISAIPGIGIRERARFVLPVIESRPTG